MIIPNHIALITDGNRRWAISHNIQPWKGHWKGFETIEKFLDWCLELDIKQVSIWALSTENFNRSKTELKELMKIFVHGLKKWLESDKFEKYEVRVNFLGDLRKFPADVVNLMKQLMEKTAKFTKKIVNILIGYGGQFELLSAFKNILQKALKSGKVRLTKRDVEKNLWVKAPVDLVIRTGGFSRLSNFMLWQTAYAELYVTKSLLPDFSKKEFNKALRWFSNQKRKFGK